MLLPGLGDALCAAPIIRGLIRTGRRLDALVMLPAVQEYAEALECFENVHFIDFLSPGPREYWRMLALRKARYELAVLPFPAARWQYAAVGLAVGAGRMLVHRYGGAATFFARLASAREIALEGGHRIVENARLIETVSVPESEDLRYMVPRRWGAPRRAGLVGVHVGTMVYKGNEARRWPIDRFRELVSLLVLRGVTVRAFAGAHESKETRALRRAVPSTGFELVEEPLDVAAKLLAECEVFVGNDSGLTHLAAALGVKVVALFGMSDPIRASPVGRAIVLRPSSCPPCSDEGLRRFDCRRNIGYRCVRTDIRVAQVVQAVYDCLRGDIPLLVPARTGCFQLYGRIRTPATRK